MLLSILRTPQRAGLLPMDTIRQVSASAARPHPDGRSCRAENIPAHRNKCRSWRVRILSNEMYFDTRREKAPTRMNAETRNPSRQRKNCQLSATGCPRVSKCVAVLPTSETDDLHQGV